MNEAPPFFTGLAMSLILRVNARLVNPCKHQLIWLENIIYKSVGESDAVINYSFENTSYNVNERMKNLEILQQISYNGNAKGIDHLRSLGVRMRGFAPPSNTDSSRLC